MMDLAFVIVIAGFFLLTVGLMKGCQSLMEGKKGRTQ